MVDYQDGEYHFYGEVADLGGQSRRGGAGGQGNLNFSIIKASGETYTQARDDLNRKSSRPVYLGALKVLIFTDRLAFQGVEEYLNRSRTQRNTRKSLKIITSADEPEDLLNAGLDNGSSVGLAIDNIQDNLMKEGSSFFVDIGDLLEALAVKKVGFLIPAMAVVDSHITLTGYTVFENAKKVGFIPQNERRGVVFFLNPQGSFHYEVTLNSKRYELDVTLNNKKITTLYAGEELMIQIQMGFKAVLNYGATAQPLTIADREALEDLLEEAVLDDILQALDTSQKEYALDYLGIYRHFRAQHNSAFQTIDWKQAYSDAATEVTTDVTLVQSELPQEL